MSNPPDIRTKKKKKRNKLSKAKTFTSQSPTHTLNILSVLPGSHLQLSLLPQPLHLIHGGVCGPQDPIGGAFHILGDLCSTPSACHIDASTQVTEPGEVEGRVHVVFTPPGQCVGARCGSGERPLCLGEFGSQVFGFTQGLNSRR